MKKIYTLLLFTAFVFQSALAQNDNLKQPFEIAKEEGFGYRGLKKLISMDSVYAGTFLKALTTIFLVSCIRGSDDTKKQGMRPNLWELCSLIIRDTPIITRTR